MWVCHIKQACDGVTPTYLLLRTCLVQPGCDHACHTCNRTINPGNAANSHRPGLVPANARVSTSPNTLPALLPFFNNTASFWLLGGALHVARSSFARPYKESTAELTTGPIGHQHITAYNVLDIVFSSAQKWQLSHLLGPKAARPKSKRKAPNQ
jgi:hypothetical protein